MRYLNLAKEIATWSVATRLKVGAVLIKDKRILSTGYNGTIPGYNNSCEINGVTKPTVLHAEENVLLQALKHQVDVRDSILYITHRPCDRCLRLLIAAGISKIIYIDDYREPCNIPNNILEKYEIRKS